MDGERPRTGEQAALWNGAGGRGWVGLQELIDRMFQPIEDLLADAVSPGTTKRVLDVGCGTGGTTVAVARRLGAGSSATGIDISEAMIAAARGRAKPEGSSVTFIVGDAQTDPLEPGGFDAIVSRFGVMFFEDPIEAFANLRRAASAGALLRLVAWRSAEENPFMTTAEGAASPLLPDLPARRPGEPGQFAFAEPSRVRRILEESGWSEIDIQPIDVPCAMPESALVPYLTEMGPVGRILQQADDELRARVVATVRPAFDPYVHGAEVRFKAACWTVGARA